MHTYIRCLIVVIFWFACSALAAQDEAPDSVQIRLDLIGELISAQNFERAQLEAEVFRDYLAKTQTPCPPKAVGLLSSIYAANRDPNSAQQFLDEAELDARRDTNFARRAALLDALVVEYDRWNLHDQAIAAQRQFIAARDSMGVQSRREALLRLQQRYDSLNQRYLLETGRSGEYFRINRTRALVLAGALLVILYALMAANRRNKKAWQKKLEQKDLELDVVRAQQQYAHLDTPASSEDMLDEEVAPLELVAEEVAPVPEAPKPKPAGELSSSSLITGHEQIALLIQPNRKIVLYLKSLLSDRYNVETASTANEGLHLASALLPDLIVCDAVLEGKTGIDVVRQIKLSERTNHIPVILLTPKYGQEGKIDALRAGADGWFTRPLLDLEFNNEVKILSNNKKRLHENFSGLLHLYFSDNRPPLPLDSFLQQSLEVIEANLADPNFTADLIAKKLQMSRPHFYKKLRWLTGKDPNQLIREMRLEKAKVLLEKRAGTPQAIAEMVGFSSPGNFALAFKDYFGDHTLLIRR